MGGLLRANAHARGRENSKGREKQQDHSTRQKTEAGLRGCATRPFQGWLGFESLRELRFMLRMR
jgi:hypothetical protein